MYKSFSCCCLSRAEVSVWASCSILLFTSASSISQRWDNTLHCHNKSNISIKLLLSCTAKTCVHMPVNSTETVSVSMLFERLTVMNTVIIQLISLNYVHFTYRNIYIYKFRCPYSIETIITMHLFYAWSFLKCWLFPHKTKIIGERFRRACYLSLFTLKFHI